MMKNHTRRKLLLLITAVALLAGSFILTPTGNVEAVGSYCEKTFYSDATFTDIVGERVTNCQGQTYSWGTTSIYKIASCEPCG